MMATECCSCLSQRGVDQDTCPKPRPSGCKEGCRTDCHGTYEGSNTEGKFYNNEISQCTGTQILRSDSRDFVGGTYVWSGQCAVQRPWLAPPLLLDIVWMRLQQV